MIPLTVQEVAALLRKTPSWVYRHRHDLGVVQFRRGEALTFLHKDSDWLEMCRMGLPGPRAICDFGLFLGVLGCACCYFSSMFLYAG